MVAHGDGESYKMELSFLWLVLMGIYKDGVEGIKGKRGKKWGRRH